VCESRSQVREIMKKGKILRLYIGGIYSLICPFVRQSRRHHLRTISTGRLLRQAAENFLQQGKRPIQGDASATQYEWRQRWTTQRVARRSSESICIHQVSWARVLQGTIWLHCSLTPIQEEAWALYQEGFRRLSMVWFKLNERSTSLITNITMHSQLASRIANNPNSVETTAMGIFGC